LLEWDDNDLFDEQMFQGNIQTLIGAGVHVVYTTGTDGEFYAAHDDEFRRIVEIGVESTAGSATKCAVGTNGTDTRSVLEQIDLCMRSGVDCVMPAFPFWLEIGDREWRQFLKDCCKAAGRMAVVHYNTFRAKRVLTAADYKWCADNLPLNFIGTKTSLTDFGMWCAFRFETPELVHIPLETCMVPALMTGGKAFISSTVGAMNPKLAVDWYASCTRGEWESAMSFQLRVNRVEHEVCNSRLRRQGYRAGALSKALVSVGWNLKTHRRMRKPYEAVPDKLIVEASRIVAELMPELLL